jgi:hypothetical protein
VAAAQTHPRADGAAAIGLGSPFQYLDTGGLNIRASHDAGARPDRKETRWRRRKLRPIDNRFAGAQRQPPPMPEVACNCITKLPGEKIFRHIGNEIDCLFPISGQ